MNKEDLKTVDELISSAVQLAKEEVEAKMDYKLEMIKSVIKEEIEESIPAVKDIKKIMAAIEEKIASVGGAAGAAVEVTPKFKANADFEPEYEADEIIVLKPTKENIYHKQGEEFTAVGHLATHLIRKGAATFVKIKPAEKENKNAKKSTTN